MKSVKKAQRGTNISGKVPKNVKVDTSGVTKKYNSMSPAKKESKTKWPWSDLGKTSVQKIKEQYSGMQRSGGKTPAKSSKKMVKTPKK